MKNKINLVEILKDCPKDMELDCTMFDNLFLNNVNKNDLYPIMCYTICDGIRNRVVFTEFGEFNRFLSSKCVIFPKGKTTWEGFVPPCRFEDGDILISAHGKPFILKKIHDNKICESYCGIRQNGEFVKESHNWTSNYNLRLATEDEKAKLFQAIKDNGYKWNEETKTLEKLIEPKFKVGDRIRYKADPNFVFTITSITKDKYECGKTFVLRLTNQDEYELVPNKFDINDLKPFESRVLVRNANNKVWRPTIFGCYMKDKYEPFYVLGGTGWKQCIPYEGNQQLLGKTDDCNEYYKTWE